jgi:hypothetical protein
MERMSESIGLFDSQNQKQGVFFDVGSARDFNESDSQQQEALRILRVRKLTKVSFERDWTKDGSRLAPAIDILRNGWGFEIAGDGSIKNPYWLLDPKQSPTKVRTTKAMQDAYYDSEHWELTRTKRYEFDGYRCVLCVAPCHSELECHHFRYNLFAEAIDDLVTVCAEHHKMIHNNCKLKFPTGIDLWVAERLLGVVAYPFEEWLLP